MSAIKFGCLLDLIGVRLLSQWLEIGCLTIPVSAKCI